MKKPFFLSLVLVFMLVTVVNAQTMEVDFNSSEKLTTKEQELLDERSAIVREYFLMLEKTKAKVDVLERERKLVESEKSIFNEKSLQRLDAEIDEINTEIVKLESDHEKYGLTKINKVKDQVSILASSANDYSITEIQVFYDRSVNKYLLHTAGNFTNDKWKEDRTAITSGFEGWKEIGGYDGYSAYSLHKDINTFNEEFHTLHYDDPTNSIDRTNSASKYPDSRGYAWKYQDKAYLFGGGTPFVHWSDYDNWRQIGWYYFDFVGGVPTGQSISFKASFGHTWSSTSINSISYPAGFGWTVNNNRWDDGDSATFSF